MGLGSLLAIAILANSAQLFGPANVDPEIPGSAALEAAIPFGKWGLILALLGMFFAVAGAAVETCMANAYSIAQFFGWIWGRHKKPWEAPRFTITWIVLFLLALAIVLTGVDVMTLVEFAILFSILVLPLTYLPLLLLAGDKKYMGEHANGPLAKTLGWIYFAVITARRDCRPAALSPDLGRERMTPDSPIKLVSELLDLPLFDSEGQILRHRRRCRVQRRRRARS